MLNLGNTLRTDETKNTQLTDEDMNTIQPNQFLSYGNVMERLVAEEVQQQLQQLPPKLVKYLNPVQVIAYALNRLPALYATSERGWHLQQQRAAEQFGHQIVTAVRQGLAAVQRDPLRVATPLKFPEAVEEGESQEFAVPELEIQLGETISAERELVPC